MMDRHGVRMPSNVVSLLDTLSAFRHLWPGQGPYRLQSLVQLKLARPPDPDAHNAASDARTLQDLVAFVPPARHNILERFLDDSQLITHDVERRLGAIAISSPTHAS